MVRALDSGSKGLQYRSDSLTINAHNTRINIRVCAYKYMCMCV